eukprot:CAMPEP_0168767904 /NCGR_PEP_ID=MMETSP0725-20121227/1601_1 /TAXON_ID=265536 /ORGANISM="Amphiprora sp., Strain CCMP467" /LENGTH=204 /DNA_ID=CAMNT_0008817245 /DNA_START=120 /DNA_END=734 /DNA_ORIENTATION=-
MAPASSYLQQNSVAVELLRQGNAKACAKALELSIKHAQAACAQQMDYCSQRTYKLRIVRVGNTFNEFDTPHDEASTDFDPYKGVFDLDKTLDSCDSFDEGTLDRVEILILLYNFAFTMQTIGDTNALDKALRVYTLAVECVKSIPLEEHPELNTLILAIAANQGYIYSLFFQQDQVQMVHETIQHLLTLFPTESLHPEDAFFFE